MDHGKSLLYVGWLFYICHDFLFPSTVYPTCDNHFEYLLSCRFLRQAHSTHLTTFWPLILYWSWEQRPGLILSLVCVTFDSRVSIILSNSTVLPLNFLDASLLFMTVLYSVQMLLLGVRE